MLHIELYGSINYDPCLGSSVRFSPASPSSIPSSPQDTASPLTRYRLFAWQEPRPMTRPHSPVSEVINFSCSVWWRDPGTWREVAMICRADIRWWRQDDTWSLAPHLIMTQRRSPRDIIGHWRLRMTPGHPGPGSYSIGTGNGSWLCLIHFIIPASAPLLSPPPSVIQLVHNHNESHSPQH